MAAALQHPGLSKLAATPAHALVAYIGHSLKIPQVSIPYTATAKHAYTAPVEVALCRLLSKTFACSPSRQQCNCALQNNRPPLIGTTPSRCHARGEEVREHDSQGLLLLLLLLLWGLLYRCSTAAVAVLPSHPRGPWVPTSVPIGVPPRGLGRLAAQAGVVRLGLGGVVGGGSRAKARHAAARLGLWLGGEGGQLWRELGGKLLGKPWGSVLMRGLGRHLRQLVGLGGESGAGKLAGSRGCLSGGCLRMLEIITNSSFAEEAAHPLCPRLQRVPSIHQSFNFTVCLGTYAQIHQTPGEAPGTR